MKNCFSIKSLLFTEKVTFKHQLIALPIIYLYTTKFEKNTEVSFKHCTIQLKTFLFSIKSIHMKYIDILIFKMYLLRL